MASDGLSALVAMAIGLGLACFGLGALPLWLSISSEVISWSKLLEDQCVENHAERQMRHLSTLGTGILLGAGLGIIIPEGVEAVAESYEGHPSHIQIALCLLLGFAGMLLVDQYLSSHGDGDSDHDHTEAFALDLDTDQLASPTASGSTSHIGRAQSLTFGLIIHSITDGLALGAASLPRSGTTSSATPISFVVFIALAIHKAPTALALTSSLIAHGLPRRDTLRHLAWFAAATPASAIATYSVIIGSQTGPNAAERFTGPALLLSGGSFLFVATALQPAPLTAAADRGSSERNVLVIGGMFIPLLLGAVFGHGHG